MPQFQPSPIVLVVEDNPLVALDLEDTLLRLGCRVIGPLSTLTAGVAAAEVADIDLALLDFDLGAGKDSVAHRRSPHRPPRALRLRQRH